MSIFAKEGTPDDRASLDCWHPAFDICPIVGILLLISALVMIVTVLLQSSERSGLGAVSGAAETFFGKNKAKGMDAKLALITKICAIVFVVLSIVMMFLG